MVVGILLMSLWWQQHRIGDLIMACGACSKRRRLPPNDATVSRDYDLTGGVSINSLNSRQIQARLEVFKRKFCKTCGFRYECTYTTYIECKGTNPK